MDAPVVVARTAVGLVAALLAPLASPARAQSVRGSVSSTLQAVELRPVSALDGACTSSGPCYEALPEELSVAAMQDLSLTGWGFGIEGLSATVLLRARARLGSDLVWPRTDDHFDAILAYAQLVRDRITVRVGRQEIRAGLGFQSFDGADVAWYGPTGRFRAELFGGRSLARGLREPDREALRPLEDFVPEQDVLVWGASALGRLESLSLTARYQREILRDRSGLVSDRGALDLTLPTPHGRLLGSIDYDFATDRLGKGTLAWTMPLAGGRWMLEGAATRYVPYFSLSTIWGLFEPVAYHELEGRVGWSPTRSLAVRLAGGWRAYGATHTETVLRPLTDSGEHVRLDAQWAGGGGVVLDARYELQRGPGGFLSAGDVSARVALGEAVSVGAQGTTFQRIEEYRLGDGRAFGGGVSVDALLTPRISAGGGAMLLRHTGGQATHPGTTWNQSRGWASVRVQVGEDPGMARRRSR